MNRVIAIASPNSAPTKRTIQAVKNKGLLIDMTNGRRTKAVIITDSGHVILSALAPETIASRYRQVEPRQVGATQTDELQSSD